MNEKLINRALLPALGCLIMVSSVACSSAATNNKAQTATINSTIAPTNQVQTTNPKAGDTALHITADGRLAFVDDRKLTFRTSGTVGQVNVNELDKVTKGQVLAKLDITSLEQAVKTAELALKSAESDCGLYENGIKSAEADNETMQANVKAASIDLEQAKDNLRKITYPYTYHTVYVDVPTALGFMHDGELEIMKAVEELQVDSSVVNYGEVSLHLKQALESLTNSHNLLHRSGYGTDVFESEFLPMGKLWVLRAAEFQVDRAQVAVENAENTAKKTALAVENAKTALTKANNYVDIAQNNLDIAKDALQNAIITAPFDGVVAKVNVKEGDYLYPGNYATIIVVDIIDPSRMELNVEVYELDIPNVALGQKVAISVDALPDERFEGVVTSIGSLPGSATGVVSYEVKIAFDVPQDSALKTGMGATADITVEKR